VSEAGENVIMTGRPTQRWGDTIKMKLNELGSVFVDCIHLAEDNDTVMNFQVS
jgi:hypothetical protein